MWTAEAPVGNEAAKIMFDVVPYTRGVGLDLGCGPFKPYPHWIGIDNGGSFRGMQTAANIQGDVTDLGIFATKSLDFVHASHVLEDLQDTHKALEEWWRVIKIGGYLVLYLPHKDLYPNIGEPGANTAHKHDFLPEDIVRAMKQVGGWNLKVNETRDSDVEWSFLQVYQKRTDKKHREPWRSRPEKTACVVRYGAFGDQIMASSILPGLKEQGYHVTYNTTPRGMDIVKHDPHIDEFMIQDADQVPNQLLGKYWEILAKKYDKFVNLSGSVEGAWLTTPSTYEHKWPHAVRHKYLNANYLEFTHELAEVPLPPQPRFYPEVGESRRAARERDKMGESVVLWALSGSSLHKSTPWTDAVIARILLEKPQTHIVLCGDYACEILETGWEEEPRVHCRSGDWSIRQTLTFATEQADVVVGPETGVLNAVSMLDVRKVVLLSHSSPDNLTKWWKNAHVLTPEDCDCYPCHQMHYPGQEDCPIDDSWGARICQMKITPDRIFEAITNG